MWSEQSGVLREERKKYCAGKRIFLHGASASCTMGIDCKSSKKAKAWRKKEWLLQGKKKKGEMEEKRRIVRFQSKGTQEGEFRIWKLTMQKRKA